MSTIKSIEELEALYGKPGEPSLVKEVDYITAHYKTLIEASPFVALATSGSEGLDCSPRGDSGACVRVHDERTLMMPDRRGNNRMDSLRNLICDPRVGLLFLIPGSGTTMRVNGRAQLSIDPELLRSFAVEGKDPRSVIVITVESAYFQCARAVLRAGLWDAEKHVKVADLPSAGAILAGMTGGKVGGEAYDKEWPERAKRSMW
ncbi:MAG: PPOX class probable FMN-dependent enzyme [Planctomycetota bacterium]|jgi:PPOX class probable FMN-dependent enzyme